MVLECIVPLIIDYHSSILLEIFEAPSHSADGCGEFVS